MKNECTTLHSKKIGKKKLSKGRLLFLNRTKIGFDYAQPDIAKFKQQPNLNNVSSI